MNLYQMRLFARQRRSILFHDGLRRIELRLFLVGYFVTSSTIACTAVARAVSLSTSLITLDASPYLDLILYGKHYSISCPWIVLFKRFCIKTCGLNRHVCTFFTVCVTETLALSVDLYANVEMIEGIPASCFVCLEIWLPRMYRSVWRLAVAGCDSCRYG